jgi:hypothetical protein
LAFGDRVYLRLKEDADGFAIVDQVNEAPTGGDDTIAAEHLGFFQGGKQRLRFSFDRLWVTEASAPAAEKAYAEHSRREKIDAYVTVRVFSGDAAIEELFIAGSRCAIIFARTRRSARFGAEQTKLTFELVPSLSSRSVDSKR